MDADHPEDAENYRGTPMQLLDEVVDTRSIARQVLMIQKSRRP